MIILSNIYIGIGAFYHIRQGVRIINFGKNTLLLDIVPLIFPSNEHLGKEEFPVTTIGASGTLPSGSINSADMVTGNSFSIGYHLANWEKITIGDDGAVSRPIIVSPAHLRTVKCLKDYGLYDHLLESICLSEPLVYLDMLHLMKYAKIILTDYAGVQKEADTLKVPRVTLWENAESVEMLECRWSVLVRADLAKMVDAARDISSERTEPVDVFGKGDATEMLFSIISPINT